MILSLKQYIATYKASCRQKHWLPRGEPSDHPVICKLLMEDNNPSLFHNLRHLPLMTSAFRVYTSISQITAATTQEFLNNGSTLRNFQQDHINGKTAGTPVRKQWSSCSLSLRHRYIVTFRRLHQVHSGRKQQGMFDLLIRDKLMPRKNVRHLTDVIFN